MKRNIWFLCLLLAVFLFSCRNDENSTSAGEGVLDIKVVAEGDLKDAGSRASSVDIPDVSDFELNLTDVEDGSVLSLGKFGDFVPVTTSVGEFVLSASYGDSKSEGFDALSFYGSTEVSIKDAQRTDASVVCKLDKAMVSISYTESFKDYFSDYSASIVSSNNTISFSKAETRPAYFVPGDLNVKLKVSRSGGPTDVELNPKNFLAEAQTHYKLTFDVDASTATLKIVFNDDPANTNNVEINISDSSLSADAPDVVPVGFVSGQEISLVEGNTYSESLQLTVNAYAGLSKCKMDVSSAYLQSLGWPASLELTELTPEEEALLNASGLIYKGFSGNKDKMAFIDFDKFVSYLACISTSDEIHKLTFTVIDNLTKVSDPVELVVKTKYNQFAFTGQPYVPYSSNSVVFDLTLDGDHNGVAFEEFINGAFTQIDVSRISIARTDGSLQSKVTILYPNSFVDTSAEYQVKAIYGNKNNTVTFKVEAPELTLSLANGDADVWATKAYLQVQASAKSRSSRTISSSTVEIQYKNGENWEKLPNQSYDESTGFTLTGLTHNTQYTVRAVYYVDSEIVSKSNELSMTTEEMKQLANNKFQNWTEEKGKTEHYSIWSLEGWSTMNLLTTSEGGTNDSNLSPSRDGMAYCATSGTKKTIEGYDDDSAALIRSVGWGKGSSAGAWSAGMKKTTAGELFLGTYDISGGADYGISFGSRPMAVSFYYKYTPKNPNDKFIVEVSLYDKNGEIITTGSLNESERVASNEYIKRTVVLDYSNKKDKKCSKLSVRFVSGTYLGKNGDDFNLSASISKTFEYVGSQLYIDNVELIYE